MFNPFKKESKEEKKLNASSVGSFYSNLKIELSLELKAAKINTECDYFGFRGTGYTDISEVLIFGKNGKTYTALIKEDGILSKFITPFSEVKNNVSRN